MRVFVYRNLHRQCFSIKALEGPNKGRVIARRDFVELTGVRFKVSEAGRQRVLRTGQKNVHAGVVGEWTDSQEMDTADTQPVRYNPRECSTFLTQDGQPIFEASKALLILGKYIFAKVI